MKPLCNIFKFLTLEANFMLKLLIFMFQLFVLVALLRVKVVKTCLVREVNVVNLLLIRVKLILHVTLLGKQCVEMGTLFVVLVLNMHIQSFDILGLCITSMLVKGQVVVSKVALELAHVLDKCFVLSLKRQVGSVIFVDVLNFLLHFVDFVSNFVVFVPKQIVVVVAIINLSARTHTTRTHSRKTVVSHGTVYRGDFGIVANAAKVDFSHRGALANRSSESSKLHIANWFKFKLL